LPKPTPLLHRRTTPSWPGATALALPTFARARPTTTVDDAARTIRRLQGQLRTMTVDLGAAELRERERIACQLHDELGQSFVLVRLKLGELRHAEPCRTPALIDELTELVAQSAAAARATTFELGRPAWCSGLRGVLEAIGSNLARQAGVDVRVDAPQLGIDLAEPQLGVVCRVVRELCLNVHKHARARHVDIAAALDGVRLHVSVQDDGDGPGRPIPSRWQADRSGGFGLASAQAQLRAFGGELEVTSPAGRGTRASLVLLLSHPIDDTVGSAS
jgi:signal transduction histidine kinase